jgi:antitoxin ParD1/3/4
MGTRNISLTPDLEAYIKAKVESGEYLHASEVVRDALRLLMRDDADKFERLRAEIQKGIDDADLGNVVPHDEAWKQIRERGMALLSERKKKRA